MKDPDDLNDDLNENENENENEKNEGFNPFDSFDDEDYDDDIFTDEDLKKEDEKARNLPVFKSAENIRKLTASLIATINDKDDALLMKQQMFLNACMLGAKIVGAEAGDIYTLRMENAVIIKIHARELLTQTSFCKLENLSKPEYLTLLRDEIENFRLLFIEWVKTFDRTNDAHDDWGLFY